MNSYSFIIFFFIKVFQEFGINDYFEELQREMKEAYHKATAPLLFSFLRYSKNSV